MKKTIKNLFFVGLIAQASNGFAASNDCTAFGRCGVMPPQTVMYQGSHQAGEIVIDHKHHFLYFILPNGRAIQYVAGVGRAGFEIDGEYKVYQSMVDPEQLKMLPGGRTQVVYGADTALGVAALDLSKASENRSARLAIHGTNRPRLLAKFNRAVSHGCIRLTNSDVGDLFSRVRVGTRVFIDRTGEIAAQIKPLLRKPKEISLHK
jgi:lipoprotein-anchoring transpeptidase ErfK/SrfK